jgi:hypothetical protein
MNIFEPYIERTKRAVAKLTQGELAELEEEASRRTEKAYKSFRENWAIGICYICLSPLKSFSSEKPCLHWLLRPNKFKKKHLKKLFDKYGYFSMEGYVRWVANLEARFKNINDLSFEKGEKKILETTIRYKYIEWTFSCSQSDLEGHRTSSVGNFPHFHFQMRLDGRPFIDFSDFHIPFKSDDMWKLAMINQNEIPYKHYFFYGEGMQSILQGENLEDIVEHSVPTSDETEAAFRLDTIIMAKPGKTISGADFVALIEESKKTGEPLSKLARRLDADVQTIVTPGDGVPEIAERTRTNRNK